MDTAVRSAVLRQPPEACKKRPLAAAGPPGSRPGSKLLLTWMTFFEEAAARTFTISAMAFQDADNLDLERLKGCCISVVSADGRLVPFCAYNLTSREGRSLYRRGTARGRISASLPWRHGSGKRPHRPPDRRAVPFCEALEDYQLRRVNETIDYARRNAPFYRRRLASLPAAPLSALSDIVRIPFTSPSDLADAPFSFLAVRQDDIARIVTLRTSGSTGEAKRLFFTEGDLELPWTFFITACRPLYDRAREWRFFFPVRYRTVWGTSSFGAFEGWMSRPLCTALSRTPSTPLKRSPLSAPIVSSASPRRSSQWPARPRGRNRKRPHRERPFKHGLRPAGDRRDPE